MHQTEDAQPQAAHVEHSRDSATPRQRFVISDHVVHPCCYSATIVDLEAPAGRGIVAECPDAETAANLAALLNTHGSRPWADSDRWTRVDAALIASTCSQRHVQSVIEDAQAAIARLVEAARVALTYQHADSGRPARLVLQDALRFATGKGE